MTGWVSVVLEPMTMKALQISISAMLLDMALEPMASCRPCHAARVAQPRAVVDVVGANHRARMSFWKT
jgi:hypothetical protein